MAVYIVFAPPRWGKTYFATKIALDLMKRGKKVYSNYPILDRKNQLSSLKWEMEYVKQTVFDSTIIIDEAYRFFNSRKFKDFSDDTHLFFSLSGQNGNDIYLIAQHPARIDKVVREVVDIFYCVSKMGFPEIDFMIGSRNVHIDIPPLWFKVESFLSEDDLKQRRLFPGAVYKTTRMKFERRVAEGYDTHFYRVKEKPFVPETWRDFIVRTRPDIDMSAYVKRASRFSLKLPVLPKFPKIISSVVDAVVNTPIEIKEDLSRLWKK